MQYNTRDATATKLTLHKAQQGKLSPSHLSENSANTMQGEDPPALAGLHPRYLPAIIHALPDYVFFKDSASVYLGCNQHFAHLVGLDGPEAIIGKSDFELPWQVQGDTAYRFRQDDQAVLAGTPVTNQLELLALPQQEPLIVSVSKVPLYDTSGNCYGLLGVAHDITALKKTEQALKQAQAQATLAETAKRDFLASMSHNLRTPFNGIILALDYLLSQPHPPEQKQLLTVALQASEVFMTHLIQLLNLSVSQHKKTRPPAKQAFSLVEVLQKLDALLQPAAQAKGLTLTVSDLSSLPSYVLGDPYKLHAVLLALLSNAVQFTQQGGVQLLIETRLLEDKTQKIELICHVKDTGIGIAKSKQAKLFEPFSQIKPSYQCAYNASDGHPFPGMGIGLAQAKTDLIQLGGSIAVQSQLDGGSTFTCRLPLHRCPPPKIVSTHSTITDHYGKECTK